MCVLYMCALAGASWELVAGATIYVYVSSCRSSARASSHVLYTYLTEAGALFYPPQAAALSPPRASLFSLFSLFFLLL